MVRKVEAEPVQEKVQNRMDGLEATIESILDLMQEKQRPLLKIDDRWLPVSGSINYQESHMGIAIFVGEKLLRTVVDFDAKRLRRLLDNLSTRLDDVEPDRRAVLELLAGRG